MAEGAIFKFSRRLSRKILPLLLASLMVGGVVLWAGKATAMHKADVFRLARLMSKSCVGSECTAVVTFGASDFVPSCPQDDYCLDLLHGIVSIFTRIQGNPYNNPTSFRDQNNQHPPFNPPAPGTTMSFTGPIAAGGEFVGSSGRLFDSPPIVFRGPSRKVIMHTSGVATCRLHSKVGNPGKVSCTATPPELSKNVVCHWQDNWRAYIDADEDGKLNDPTDAVTCSTNSDGATFTCQASSEVTGKRVRLRLKRTVSNCRWKNGNVGIWTTWFGEPIAGAENPLPLVMRSSKVVRFRRVSCRPTLNTPAACLATSPAPTLNWQPHEQASSYRVEFADQQGNTLASLTTENTSVTLPPALREEGIYQWRVRGEGDACKNVASTTAWESFIVGNAPPAAILQEPSSNASFPEAEEVTFRWTYPADTNFKHLQATLELESPHGVIHPFTISSPSASNSFTVKLGELNAAAGERWRWRVRTSHSLGCGESLSADRFFTITPAPSHTACVDEACITVAGAGEDECQTDVDCAPPPSHNQCVGEVCMSVPGVGENQCQTDADCRLPPTPTPSPSLWNFLKELPARTLKLVR